jgi:hypothetical protein
MTPEGSKLDQHLDASIKEFGGNVPEIGGKSLADHVRVGLAGLKKDIDALKIDAAAALTELSTEVRNGNEGVRRIRAETAAVRAAFSEILGNQSDGDRAEETGR